MYPVSGTSDLSRAYTNGRCRDCGAKIQPLGPSSRCEQCDYKFTEYVDSCWGLDSLIAERNQNQILGLCFYCGNGLEGPDERLCAECQLQSQNGQWCKSMFRKGRQSVPDRNPYLNVWENNDVDNAVHLDATYATVAEQMLSKAKYYKRKAERGGPRGRENLKEAQRCIRSAITMLEKDREIRYKSK